MKDMEWISVYKRVPKDGENVICCYVYGSEEYITLLEYDARRNRFICPHTSKIMETTHWMPLPNTPNHESKKKNV